MTTLCRLESTESTERVRKPYPCLVHCWTVLQPGTNIHLNSPLRYTPPLNTFRFAGKSIRSARKGKVQPTLTQIHIPLMQIHIHMSPFCDRQTSKSRRLSNTPRTDTTWIHTELQHAIFGSGAKSTPVYDRLLKYDTRHRLCCTSCFILRELSSCSKRCKCTDETTRNTTQEKTTGTRSDQRGKESTRASLHFLFWVKTVPSRMNTCYMS